MTQSTHSAAGLMLFCIPHAGGGASVYRNWASDLAPDVIVKRPQLPGREGRFGEPALTTLDSALADLLRSVNPDMPGPYAVFGHSMGALLAFELAHRLRDNTGREPVHFFVSACRAPHFPPMAAPCSDLPQKEFVEVINQRYGGIPDAILADDAMMSALLPAIRADFRILEHYRAADRPPLNCPISAFGGWNDTATPLSTIEAWRHYTTGSFNLTMFDDGQFYLQSKKSFLIDKVLVAVRNAPVELQ
jgi:medium-chain acyl-[acyl-carrier-protein] hydrolase